MFEFRSWETAIIVIFVYILAFNQENSHEKITFVWRLEAQTSPQMVLF